MEVTRATKPPKMVPQTLSKWDYAMAVLEVFSVFLSLGLTSFGGPIAHLGYFHKEFVVKRKWITEHVYADLVALCQFLPGPASSQIGMAIGLSRAGYLGAAAAWLGFTLPSAILLVLFAIGISNFGDFVSPAVLHGLKIAAVAVVAQAIWLMGVRLCPDKERVTLAIIAAAYTSVFSSALAQVVTIVLGAFLGWLFLTQTQNEHHEFQPGQVSRHGAVLSLTFFVFLLVSLPFAAALQGGHALKLFDSFFRVGSLVFGGGHVVLPLLQAEVVPTGWVSSSAFMAGYGAAQAIPGPLFAFAAYLGAVSSIPPSGWVGAALCLVAIFLPSFLLIVGFIPFWDQLRALRGIRSAMMGVNAVVVGLLLAAFHNPVWTNAIFSVVDFCITAVAFALLVLWKARSWSVVAFCAIVGWFSQL